MDGGVRSFSITAKELARITERAGLEPSHVRGDYSGREMFSGTCVAVVGTDKVAAFIVAFTAEMGETAAKVLRYMPTDSMARRTVYYWPLLAVWGADERRRGDE